MVRLATATLLLLAGAPLALAAEPAASPANVGPSSATEATKPQASELAREPGGSEQSAPVRWQSWRAGNSVLDSSSIQRGARNFMNYCNGCHSLKYMRYQRMADDLQIPTSVMTADLVAPGSSSLDYIGTAMPAADAINWFGKQPPDLSLIARSRTVDYLYQYLKTFYSDPSRPTRSDNLAYPTTAMPAVLSDLEGVKAAVFRDAPGGKVFDHFETISPGNMTPEQFDGFVRDIVNFLDYVGDPSQVERRRIGLFVVLFLLALTALAYMLKKEYWKDVH
ncbi:MAG TPA: cytochrome c1 [Steroidobacteraceae bacterium]|jgi:ubiquinol-cytochrome c reductase cytochrome c1 subunit